MASSSVRVKEEEMSRFAALLRSPLDRPRKAGRAAAPKAAKGKKELPKVPKRRMFLSCELMSVLERARMKPAPCAPSQSTPTPQPPAPPFSSILQQLPPGVLHGLHGLQSVRCLRDGDSDLAALLKSMNLHGLPGPPKVQPIPEALLSRMGSLPPMGLGGHYGYRLEGGGGSGSQVLRSGPRPLGIVAFPPDMATQPPPLPLHASALPSHGPEPLPKRRLPSPPDALSNRDYPDEEMKSHSLTFVRKIQLEEAREKQGLRGGAKGAAEKRLASANPSPAESPVDSASDDDELCPIFIGEISMKMAIRNAQFPANYKTNHTPH